MLTLSSLSPSLSLPTSAWMATTELQSTLSEVDEALAKLVPQLATEAVVTTPGGSRKRLLA